MQPHPDPDVAAEDALLGACVAAAMYPSVAKLTVAAGRPGTSSRANTPVLRLVSGTRVFVHPASVNAACRQRPTRWLMFNERIDIDRPAVKDTCWVSVRSSRRESSRAYGTWI